MKRYTIKIRYHLPRLYTARLSIAILVNFDVHVTISSVNTT